MNKNTKVFADALLSIAIMVLILSSLGYFSFKERQLNTEPSKNPLNLTSPIIPVGTVTNWKTYTNNKLGFQIKIPTEWHEPKEYVLSTGTEVKFDNSLFFWSGVSFNQSFNRTLTFDEFTEVYKPADSQVKDYGLGGKEGKMFTYRTGEGLYENLIAVPYPSENEKNGIFTVTYNIYPGEIETSEIINQILSTMIFTDENTAASVDPSYKANYSPRQAKQIISDKATAAMQYLENQDYTSLSNLIHPTKGIKLQNNFLTATVIKNINKSPATTYPFYLGALSEPTFMTVKDYLESEITPVKEHEGKFSTTAEVYYNEFRVAQGYGLNFTLEEYGPDVIEVEYYYPGTEKFAEHDYESLQLIYLPQDSNWYLVEINRRYWTP